MGLNNNYQARTLEYNLQKILEGKKAHEYFISVFGDDDKAATITGKLAELCRSTSCNKSERDSDRPGQRFINLVHRENEIERWAIFIRHEQKRAKSKWADSELKDLPDRLEKWRKSLSRYNDGAPNTDPAFTDPVLNEMRKKFEELNMSMNIEELSMNDEKCMIIGLRAFRTMLWRLRGGENS